MGYRVERVNELIRNELSVLIDTKLKDPRLDDAIVSVTRVKTTPDMKYAKVFVSVMGDSAKKEEILSVLEGAKGYLRKSISKVLTTRNTPLLMFEIDDSLDYASHIEDILATLNIKEEE